MLRGCFRLRVATLLAAASFVVCVPSTSRATVFNSPAPGTALNKATAVPIGPMTAGDQLVGTVATTSTQSSYQLISVAPAPLAIYRHRLTFTDQANNIRAWVRGLNQSGGVVGTTDSLVQSANASAPGYMQWYGFGKAEQFYLQTFGTTTSNPLTFELTMSTETITPMVLPGGLLPGQIVIETTGSATDRRHLHILDGDLSDIPGYQDVDTATRGLFLDRTYAPGTYYVAIGQRNVASNLPQPAGSGSRSETVLDFPNLIVAGQPNANATDLSLKFTDSNGTPQTFSLTRAGSFDVQWLQFTVVPEPASAALLVLAAGVIVTARRR